jgi:hypothetical protein
VSTIVEAWAVSMATRPMVRTTESIAMSRIVFMAQ